MNFKNYILVVVFIVSVAMSTPVTLGGSEFFPLESKVIVTKSSSECYSVELVDNTDFCFECYSIYRFKNLCSTPLEIGDVLLKIYDVDDRVLNKDVEVEVLLDKTHYESKDIIERCEKESIYQDNVTKGSTPRTEYYDCVVGSELVQVTEKVYQSLDSFSSVKLPLNGVVDVRVSGDLGFNEAVDNRLTLLGEEIHQFAWWNSTFDYCRNITITGVGSTNLTDFPMFINITNMTNMNSDLSDLRFVNESCGNDGIQLDHDVENYTASESHIWVEIPDLRIGNNTISLYYGEAGATNSEDKIGTWNSGYELVWHFSDNVTDTAFDSTSNNNYGTKKSANNPVQSATKRVTGTGNDFSSDYIVSNANIGVNATRYITIEAWAESDNIQTWDYIFDINGQLFRIGQENQGGQWSGIYDIVAPGSLQYLNYGTVDNNLHYWVLTWDGSLASLYQDGVEVANSAEIPDNEVASFVMGVDNTGGSAYWDGMIDEARVSNVPRSGDWINQSYQMIANQGITVISGESVYVPASSVPPVMNDTYFNPSSPTNSDNFDCVANATDVDNETLTFEWYVYKDGALTYSDNGTGNQSLDVTLVTINSSATSTGELWNCSVRAYDGVTYSAFIQDSTTILNSVPSMNSVELTPSSPTEEDDIDCFVNASDIDNSTLIFEWYVWEGIHLEYYGNTTGNQSDSVLVVTINSSATSTGELWNCSARAYDGINYSSLMMDSVTIIDVPRPLQILSDYDYDTTTEVILLFVMILLWLGLIAVGSVFGNEGFVVVGYLVGILVGFMFARIHILFTLFVVLLNASSLAFMFLKNN